MSKMSPKMGDQSHWPIDSYVFVDIVNFGALSLILRESKSCFRSEALDGLLEHFATRRTWEYDIATKNGLNRLKIRWKIDPGDLAGHDVACQVLPHLVLLIPTPKSVGTDKNSGESDKTESASLYVLPAHFQRKHYLILGSLPLVEGQFREGALVKSIVVWTIYKERIGNSTVGK